METEGAIFFEEVMKRTERRSKYIEFKFYDGEAVLDDIRREKVDERDIVGSDDNNEDVSQNEKILDERSTDIGIKNDTGGSSDNGQ